MVLVTMIGIVSQDTLTYVFFASSYCFSSSELSKRAGVINNFYSVNGTLYVVISTQTGSRFPKNYQWLSLIVENKWDHDRRFRVYTYDKKIKLISKKSEKKEKKTCSKKEIG